MIFRNWVLQNFPFLEDDFDALTDYELFCKMVEYMKKSLDKIKDYQNELNEFRSELDTYKNYFDNLDVQEEINNKLDEMASSGQLTDIIAQYLNLAGVLAFNTVSDMVEGENLVNGSICRTLGQTTYNDGRGSYYKVRTITSGDVVDGVNIIALDVSDTLIAEKINDYNLDLLLHKKFIFIGDSYNTTDTPDGGTQIVPWASLVKNYLGLSDNQYYSSGVSGAGWSVEDNQFIDQLEDFDEVITNKNEITDIYVLGGINDNQITASTVYNDILAFADYAKLHYPKAIVTIGIISWSVWSESKINLLKKLDYYNTACNRDNLRFISNSYTWYHLYTQYQTDGHPTSAGSTRIATCLANYIKGGVSENGIYYEGYIYRDNNNIGIPSSQPTIGTMKQFLNGENVNLLITFDNITLQSSTIAPSTSTPYILGSVDNLFIRTKNDPLPIHCGSCWGYDTTSTSYINMTYTLYIQESQLKIMFYYVDKTSGNVTFNFSIIVMDKIPILNIPLAFS